MWKFAAQSRITQQEGAHVEDDGHDEELPSGEVQGQQSMITQQACKREGTHVEDDGHDEGLPGGEEQGGQQRGD